MIQNSKMRVVKNGKKNHKNTNDTPWFLQPIMLIFKFITFLLMLLFGNPSRPAYLLGFIRLVIFGFTLYCMPFSWIADSTRDFASLSPQHSHEWLWVWYVGIFLNVLLILYNILIMFGITSNTVYNGGQYSDYTGIDTMMQLVDGRLSSNPGNRTKILKKLFDE